MVKVRISFQGKSFSLDQDKRRRVSSGRISVLPIDILVTIALLDLILKDQDGLICRVGSGNPSSVTLVSDVSSIDEHLSRDTDDTIEVFLPTPSRKKSTALRALIESRVKI